VGDLSEPRWYVSRRSVIVAGMEYRVEGTSAWSVAALEPGTLGDTARWMLDLEDAERDARWRRRWWQTHPPDPAGRLVWRPAPTLPARPWRWLLGAWYVARFLRGR
jgi:hypothetical protein